MAHADGSAVLQAAAAAATVNRRPTMCVMVCRRITTTLKPGSRRRAALYHHRSAVPAESRDTVGHTDWQGSILRVLCSGLLEVDDIVAPYRMSSRGSLIGQGLHAAVAGPAIHDVSTFWAAKI